MISETVPATSPRGCSFDPLPPCQSHGSTGLAANDLLSPMVQMSPAQEGTRRGWDASPAVPNSREEYSMQPKGTRGSETPHSPRCLLAQLCSFPKGCGMEQEPQNTLPSLRHWCQCASTPPSRCHAGGPPRAEEPHSHGSPCPEPAPSSCCVCSHGCLHGNGVCSVARVAMYTWTAVGLPQIKMMKYSAGPGVHQGSPIPSHAQGPHLRGLQWEVLNLGCWG